MNLLGNPMMLLPAPVRAGRRRRRRGLRLSSLLLSVLSCRVAEPFSVISLLRRTTNTGTSRTTTLSSIASDHQVMDDSPTAVLLGTQSLPFEEEQSLVDALRSVGYSHVLTTENVLSNDESCFRYELSRATGMLKLVTCPKDGGDSPSFDAPQWVPVVRGEENVLVANGWSFLDRDESEQLSAFDIDAANAEGLYRPKWGAETSTHAGAAASELKLSSLGYDIAPLEKECILAEADSLSNYNEYSRGVLLNGNTDPPNTKRTFNGYDFRGSAGQADVPSGIFTCALGGLPLFATTDLAPTTGSSGWLSFSRPIANDHVELLEPEKDSTDRRIEVVCARSKCHLGHYFGPGEGYCINASALSFLPIICLEPEVKSEFGLRVPPTASRPVSWRCLDFNDGSTPSIRLLKSLLATPGRFESVALGAGCFWHVEASLRRLPGIVSTEAGYAGGNKVSPTYKEVCDGKTGHAEVVKIVYDPDVCPNNMLFDCFLAIHDPTKVRAHGKHSQSGQYRSCMFVTSAEVEHARSRLEKCREQLGKELSTEIRLVKPADDPWFWRAEDRHQRHDEVVKGKESDSLSTLAPAEWLKKYGRRAASIVGSSETMPIGMDHPNDDGMARMMI